MAADDPDLATDGDSPADPVLDPLIAQLAFDDDGLVPAVVQDQSSHEVLMVAWMSAESVAATMAEGRTVFWSRSRRELWRKGETSGHVQRVRDLRVDCDGDTLLVLVDQLGPACHTGRRSCFHRRPADLRAPNTSRSPAPPTAPVEATS